MIMKKLIAAVIAAFTHKQGVSLGRMRVHDNYSAFPFRMGAGFAGDINRTHPVPVEATLIDETYPVLLGGNAGILDSVSHAFRKIVAADQSDATDLLAWGMAVRPYPTQQSTGGMTSTIGAYVPPVEGVLDVMRKGLIMVKLNTGVADSVKGGRVYVWAAATSGNHIQGGYETEYSTGNTVRLTASFTYNGPPDANGITELNAGF